MLTGENISSAFKRIVKTLRARPSFGRGTIVSKTTVTDGLTCMVREGEWSFIVDMPQELGGKLAGPTPGVYGRAALGSCLAIGYIMRASAMGIPITSLSVEVHADFDDAGMFDDAPNGIRPGYSSVRYVVSLVTAADENQVIELLDEADRHSPYLDVFSKPLQCQRQVIITKP